MKTLTVAEFQDYLAELVQDAKPCELELDNEGQITIYTGVYYWQDGTLHDQPEHP